MKSKFVLFAFLLFGSLVFSQDIKIKNDDIIINGTAVGKIIKEKTTIVLKDLSSQNEFHAKITNRTPLGNTASVTWLELMGPNSVVREMELPKGVGFSLNGDKYIVETLLKSNLPFFSTSGIDGAKMKEFFQKEDRSISKAADIEIEAYKKVIAAEDSIAKANNLFMDQYGIISANKQKIGYIIRQNEPSSGPMDNRVTYKALDLNKVVFASVTVSVTSSQPKEAVDINLYDGNKLPFHSWKYSSSSSEDMTQDRTAERILKLLYSKGYTFGDMKSQMQIANKERVDDYNNKVNEVVQNAKSQSKNLYDVSGYVIDKNGEKKEGTITVEFESISSKLPGGNGVTDVTIYGTSVQLKANGKSKFYQSKDDVRFCAEDRCFLGASGSENMGIIPIPSSPTGLLNTSFFFEIVYEKEGNFVLVDPRNPKYYYLKLANQSKAVYLGNQAGFGTKKPEKVKEIFDQYMNCPALDSTKYDTTSQKEMIQLLEDFLSKCK
ncbi:MAG: hypothetical protein C4K58_04475 [Flavobacteriaceae bacterium]|nr:MAG: hypothetical protein C4K58_04475 [Flavobacteriaceae bacterium]